MYHNEDLPMPPKEFQDSVGGYYYTSLEETFELLRKEGRLNAGSKVLDVGCGCGRVASPLTKVLRDGEYHGIDVVHPMIEWCKTYISTVYKNFYFHHAALQNSHYSNDGAKASEYRFPARDGFFDLVFAASLYTHLVPDSAAQYLRETARVLQPNGVALLWFFISSPETNKEGKQLGVVDFKHPYLEGCSVLDPESPEAAIAFEEQHLFGMIRDAGLSVCNISYGRWSGHPTGWGWQDVVLVRRQKER